MTSAISAVSFRAGPLTSAGAILWVHGDNISRHAVDYAEAPPTISRALRDPLIAGPFALAMIVSAIFLTFAIAQVVLALHRVIRQVPGGRAANEMLLAVIAVCEAMAVAGMIVLSQYTGSIDAHLHDIGSYMLFFGHAIGISLSGWLIRRLISASRQKPAGAAARMLEAVEKNPRRALSIALLSAFYGVVYFGGKLLPDSYFFWQRAVLSFTEVIVILAFLAYFSTFWPMVRASKQRFAAGQLAPALAQPES